MIFILLLFCALEYSGEPVYVGMARKLGLIDDGHLNPNELHPQVVDVGNIHHKLHAACAFYRSGFEEAAAVVVDGCSSFPFHAHVHSPHVSVGACGMMHSATTCTVVMEMLVSGKLH